MNLKQLIDTLAAIAAERPSALDMRVIIEGTEWDLEPRHARIAARYDDDDTLAGEYVRIETDGGSE